jgi:hypothetical protein
VDAPLRDRLQSSLKSAMRERDATATSVLRTTLSAIANAEAVEVPAGDAAGDPACWLHELCPDCGAVPDAPTRRCWRCGHEVGRTA